MNCSALLKAAGGNSCCGAFAAAGASSEAFVWRRWLYLLWDEVDSLVNTGRFDRARFDLAAKSILPRSPELPFSHCQTRPRVS